MCFPQSLRRCSDKPLKSIRERLGRQAAKLNDTLFIETSISYLAAGLHLRISLLARLCWVIFGAGPS
jgi:hypothetical protein